jgi:hypothetical protein
MLDSMHRIELGVIIRLIMAILKKYWDDVLQYLRDGSDGLVAKKNAGVALQAAGAICLQR